MNGSYKISDIFLYELPVSRFDLADIYYHIYFIGTVFYCFVCFKNFGFCGSCSQRKTDYCTHFYPASTKLLIA